MDRITPRDIDARLKVIAETQPRSPQEHINAAQIRADELADSWLARHGLKIAAALMVLVFAAVTVARAADKLEADLDLYHQFRSMK